LDFSTVSNYRNYLRDFPQPKLDVPSIDLADYQEIKYRFKNYQDPKNPSVKGIKINLTIHINNPSRSAYNSTSPSKYASKSKIKIILLPNQCIQEPLEYGDYTLTI
jgi:hypothetical protein